MKAKSSFIKLIKVWGVIFLTGIGTSIILLNIFTSYRDFHSQAERMRTDYIARQELLIRQEVDRVIAMIDYEKSRAEAVTKDIIQSRVNEAHSIAQHIYEQYKSSKDKAEIQQMILEALRPIRFSEGSGYYFATRLDGIEMLFADKPEMEGLNLLDVRDTHGKYVVKDMIEIARRSGEGFYEYHWTKPNEEGNEFKKLSFVKRFEPFDWIIGTGLYVDDVKEQIKTDLLSSISRIRFGKEGYIFVNRLNGDALVSNGKRFSGTQKLWQVFNEHPEKMKEIFAKELEAATKPDGDYIYYSFIKLTAPDKESPKVSFVYGIPEWQWLVGAGVYLDDVEAEIALMQAELNKQIKDKTLFSIMIALGIVALFLLLFQRLSRRLEDDFNLLLSFFSRAALADEEIKRDQVHFDELDHMAQNANSMVRHKMEARQALLDEREKLLITIRSIGDGLITTDTSGNVILMNRVAEQLTGWTNEEAYGKPLSDIFHIVNTQTGEKAENPVDRVLAEGVIAGLANHTKLISRDNSEYQIADSAAPITGVDGRTSGVVLVFRDVSTEYRMREKLRDNEQFLNSVLESIQDGISILNPDLTIRHVNGIMKKWHSDNLPFEGKKCFTCYRNADKPCDPCPTLRCLKSGQAEMDVVSELSSAEVKWIELYSYPIKDSTTGAVTGVVELVRDITGRQQAAEDLREHKERLELALKGAELGTWDWQVPTGQVTFNDRWAGMLGYRPDEIEPHLNGWKKLVHPDDLARVMPIITDHLEGRTSIYQAEFRMRTKSGGWKWILATGKVVTRDKQGNAVRVAGTHLDISMRKKTEEELQKMDRLESVGTLAGGIAHDFNNILMGLFGNISIARKELTEAHPAFNALREAEKSMKRATSLTRQLLTFAKGGEPVKEDVSLGALVEETVRFDLSGSKVKPVFKQADDLWPAAVDRGQMQQVFSNLTINARQAMPDGGHLFIIMENQELSENIPPNLQPGRYIRVTVRDEGVGIDPENLERIFDIYFTTKETGNGLGLATTYSIITRHGGHISVESEPGKGTLFTLHLPAAEAQQIQAADKPVAEVASTRQNAKILIMDDEEVIRGVTEKMLEIIGYKAQSANDGKQAVEMYRQAMTAGEPFDAVIMDLTIPGGMGGEEAMRRILALDPEAKGIVSSGYTDGRIMANFANYGFRDIVPKPYSIGRLQEVLSRVLGKQGAKG